MKKIKLNPPKLTLKKDIIGELAPPEMRNIIGGGEETNLQNCPDPNTYNQLTNDERCPDPYITGQNYQCYLDTYQLTNTTCTTVC